MEGERQTLRRTGRQMGRGHSTEAGRDRETKTDETWEGRSRNRPKGVLNPGVIVQREMPPGQVKCITKSVQCQALARNSETLW